MSGSRAAVSGAATVGLALVLGMMPSRGPASEDALAGEIERWLALVQTSPSTEEMWMRVKPDATALLVRAREDRAAGRPLIALFRLAAARENLAAAAYLGGLPESQRRDAATFEAEWARMGRELENELAPLAGDPLGDLHPAALRALAEASLPLVRAYHEASLQYGRSTSPEYGLFQLGGARAQHEFLALCPRLSGPPGPPSPPVREIAGELDALEAEMLAAYRPPASLDKHREFITASSALKTARELDASGLRHGALLRYLQASLRLAPLRSGFSSLDADLLRQELRAARARVSPGDRDHSLARLFVEMAEADLAGADPAGAAVATAVVRGVLPRYFAALAPAPPRASPPSPSVAVTLVRWPYT
jgi:hypothetical protein